MAEINFHWLVESSLDVIAQVGLEGLIQYVSPSSLEVLGWPAAKMIGRSPKDFVLPADFPLIASAMATLATGQVEQCRTTVRNRRPDNSVCWIETTARIMRDPQTGERASTVLVLRDVTERKALEDRLSLMALQDGLTGLANRRAFDLALEREWQRTLREGLDLSLLLLDVDRFKSFNDQYGHQVGDDCLRAVAAAIERTLVRPADVAARYGGEEIAIILPRTDAAGAAHVAEQIRASIEALALPHAGNPEGGGWVTASLGAATALPRAGGTTAMPQGILAAADSALYKAKQSGRNRVVTSLVLTPDESLI